ncbi:hypothetical protein FB446DRAFT_33764 [Lentinula raphanica]|nr:hypothetical protein FB446DRAFT_33764 [Lentinula raphanica]
MFVLFSYPLTFSIIPLMVLPIVRTISMASLFLILLASALAPGLMAAPLSVSVQTPPIEQNVERRGEFCP